MDAQLAHTLQKAELSFKPISLNLSSDLLSPENLVYLDITLAGPIHLKRIENPMDLFRSN